MAVFAFDVHRGMIQGVAAQDEKAFYKRESFTPCALGQAHTLAFQRAHSPCSKPSPLLAPRCSCEAYHVNKISETSNAGRIPAWPQDAGD